MVVVVLCLVCSVIVAGAAVGLKPMQEEQKQLDKQRNILAVAGLMQGDKLDGEQVKTLFGQRIEPRLLDLKTGEFTSGDP
ncbi:MAG: Na(+)-translocating NADH-quinone reductase subunit C, partial [Enterobacterales bacterium]|nr:Na(+)-translocating NADH-quinone reductase subunit C [Enterobacterales bacterium]